MTGPWTCAITCTPPGLAAVGLSGVKDMKIIADGIFWVCLIVFTICVIISVLRAL